MRMLSLIIRGILSTGSMGLENTMSIIIIIRYSERENRG